MTLFFGTSMELSLYIALFVAFIDYMGVGLIYPLFSSMLFDPMLSLASRLIIGFVAGNMSIVQAVIADLSSKDEKAKNFSWSIGIAVFRRRLLTRS